jgi:hypothetical protein
MTEQLPTYEQITSWLGDGWTICGYAFLRLVLTGPPWWETPAGYVLYLRHDDGTRVEVRAPEMKGYRMTEARWRVWFGRIEKRMHQWGRLYNSHVTWHEAETKKVHRVEKIFSDVAALDLDEWRRLREPNANAIAMAAGDNDGTTTVRVDYLKVGDWFAKDGSEWRVSVVTPRAVTAKKNGTGDGEFFSGSIRVLPLPDQDQPETATATVRVDSLKPGDWFRAQDRSCWRYEGNGRATAEGESSSWPFLRALLVTPIPAPPCPRTAPTPPISTPEATGAQNGQEGGTEAEERVSENWLTDLGVSISPAIWQSFEDAVDHANQEMRKVLFDKGWLSNHADELAKAVTEKRWPNVPATDIPRLERLLAEQVAHGGQDGGAARHMLVMRERVRAEQAKEEAARSEAWKRSRAGYEAVEKRFDPDEMNGCKRILPPSPGIAGLRLERPLIAFRRSGR